MVNKKWRASSTLGVTDDLRYYYVYCLLHFSNWWYRLTLLNAVTLQNIVLKTAFYNLIYDKITVGNVMIIQETSLHFTFSISKKGHRAIMRVQNYDYFLVLIITLTGSETSAKWNNFRHPLAWNVLGNGQNDDYDTCRISIKWRALKFYSTEDMLRYHTTGP